MTRADMPLYPCTYVNEGDLNASAPDGEVVPPGGSHEMAGLSIREHFAGLAMQGLLTTLGTNTHDSKIAEWSVQCADALLAELAKPNKPVSP